MSEKIEITNKELQLILTECVRQNIVKEKDKKKQLWFDIFRVTLTPLVIAIVGWQATLHINEREIQNTELLAEKQIQSARIIADKNIDAANFRSDADRDIERLSQIKSIYEKIISDAVALSAMSRPAIKLQMSSLEIYGDLALAFLVNIRDFYKEKYLVVSEVANESIVNILKASQPNFVGYLFEGQPDDLLNLRTRKFVGYNFSGSEFRNVNLFKAQFNRSTLRNMKFKNVDLYEADFSEANLCGTIFSSNTNLRRTNFAKAKLKDVQFKNCEHLVDAQFSLEAILKADKLPFSKINRTDYINLLSRHRAEIENVFKSDQERLAAMLKKVEYEYDELISRLIRKEEEMSMKKHWKGK